jgi:hypothetical protein
MLVWTIYLAAASAPHAEVHFWIRSDDSQALNADAGWEAALDANASMEAQKKFRIRFEIEDAEPRSQSLKQTPPSAA